MQDPIAAMHSPVPIKKDQHLSESPSIHKKGSDTNDDCVEKDVTSEKAPDQEANQGFGNDSSPYMDDKY